MQSGRPAASGGFVELLVEFEPVAVEAVLLPLIVLLPLLVPGVSVRTCLVTASQHFPALVLVIVELGEVVVVVGIWAIAIPMPPASIAAASPIPIIRMRRIPSWWQMMSGSIAVTEKNRVPRSPFLSSTVTKRGLGHR